MKKQNYLFSVPFSKAFNIWFRRRHILLWLKHFIFFLLYLVTGRQTLDKKGTLQHLVFVLYLNLAIAITTGPTVIRMSSREEHFQDTATLMSCLTHYVFGALLSLSDLFKYAQDSHWEPLPHFPTALTFWLLPSSINLHHHLARPHLCVTSELHSSQVATWGNRSQYTLRQTLGLLHSAATTRPVGLPGVSLMIVTAAFKSSCSQTSR